MRNQSINDFMEECRMVIFNAADDEVINQRMLPFGYDEAKHQANKQLYNDTLALIAQNKQEHAEWENASNTFNNSLLDAKDGFNLLRRRLRFWYDAKSDLAVTLGLYSDKISRYSDFVQTAKNFYEQLLLSEEAQEKLLAFGYTSDMLTEMKQQVDQLDQLRSQREKESGDAQYAIKERNAKMDQLHEVAEEVKRLGRLIFLDDEAQYLEKLGIIVKS